jgi:hypothetical protein
MDENGRPAVPELNFTFMVLQPYLEKNFIWYYLDGNQSRRTLNIDSFLQLVKDRFPELLKDVSEALKSKSFFLLNAEDHTLTHLFPSANMEPYLDSIKNLVQDKKTGKRTPRLIGEKQDITEILSSYGFATPTKQSTESLRVTLEKKDPTTEGFISRFMNRGRNG